MRIVDAVRVLGIEMRVGHPRGRGRGARRSKTTSPGWRYTSARAWRALAGPSEVLVSSTVRDIVTGSRHRFDDRGETPLKGVPGQWRLYALRRERAIVMR